MFKNSCTKKKTKQKTMLTGNIKKSSNSFFKLEAQVISVALHTYIHPYIIGHYNPSASITI